MAEIVVVLHNVRSLYNVGSVFRTADAAGVGKIYLCGITPAPSDRFGKIRQRFAKVSLGAEKCVAWEKAASAARIINRLKNDGWKIFAIEQNKKSTPYYKLKIENLKLKIALVFGNERAGLPPSVWGLADKILEIPMRGKLLRYVGHPRRWRGSLKALRSGRGKESLNVAVALGIVLFGILY